jgi:hypothetical protein
MAISRIRRSTTTSIKVRERTPVTTVSTKTLIRSMQQINLGTDTPLQYEFHFGISTFTHDSSGVLYTEIPRPLNLPLVDATSQKLERCSFEFLIAVPYDSLGSSIDSHITLLQDFANEARPVQFYNVHSALATKTWNIDSITFQVTRVNESGQATAVTCNMSLVESIAKTERFIQLPKFTYTIPKGASLSSTTGTGPDGDKTPPDGTTNSIIRIQGTSTGITVATTATNHGLKSGTYVKITMMQSLAPSILALNAGGAPVQITVSSVTPTKFTYRSPGGGFLVDTAIASGDAIYTVTSAIASSSAWVPTVIPSSYTNTGNTATSTTKTANKPDKVVTIDATVLAYDGVGPLTKDQVAKYLYGLKSSNQDLYNREIGTSDSAAYQKAVSYLTKLWTEYGQDIRKVTLQEIVQNI